MTSLITVNSLVIHPRTKVPLTTDNDRIVGGFSSSSSLCVCVCGSACACVCVCVCTAKILCSALWPLYVSGAHVAPRSPVPGAGRALSRVTDSGDPRGPRRRRGDGAVCLTRRGFSRGTAVLRYAGDPRPSKVRSGRLTRGPPASRGRMWRSLTDTTGSWTPAVGWHRGVEAVGPNPKYFWMIRLRCIALSIVGSTSPYDGRFGGICKS